MISYANGGQTPRVNHSPYAAKYHTISTSAGFAASKRMESYEEVGRVSEIFIYPVKSCRGLAVEAAEVTPTGLKYQALMDRHWLVVNEKDHFLTARQEPSLVLVTSSLAEDGSLCLDAPGKDTLRLPVNLEQGRLVHTKVFAVAGEGVDCGDEAAEWFSSYLNRPGTRLLFSASNCKKRDLKEWKMFAEFAETGDEVAFPDYAAFMMLSEASLDNLNAKLDLPVTIRNFRPNIVVTGCSPHAEDSWKSIRVGKAEFRRMKQCDRCVFTTIDPETGVKGEKEPLETLRLYRQAEGAMRKKVGTSPMFGSHLAADREGTIRVGDTVYAVVD
ncbi:mitochondrial amidoxime reducing component 2-like isoform X2 [Branchiostoma floridae]|uniref:Mitochondrial amidoxime reducing component 2-like isoform X2 n=1 Tax=Branchiostoma floridae TaxID=7739 RepID=A0A9J7HWI8_BRAFL|nr:mitochondrial amidoxime reducing component 2-like isoform X2 [Branchiostoma floridae]